MALPNVALNDPHVPAHNAERAAINALQTDSQTKAALDADVAANAANNAKATGAALVTKIKSEVETKDFNPAGDWDFDQAPTVAGVPIGTGSGSGTITSVNGDAGPVVNLTASEVGAVSNEELESSLQTVSVEGHGHTTSDISDLENWRVTNQIPTIKTYDSASGELPGVIGNSVLWLDLASAVLEEPAITYVTHQHNTTNAASWAFTPETLLNAFPDDYFIAFVWTANSTTLPANDADSLTGGGMTWTAIGAPQSSGTGLLTLSIFRTTGGTPDGTNLVVGATGGTEGCSIEVVAVNDLPYQNVFLSGAGALSTATLALSGTTPNQRIIAGIGWNTGTQTITADPGVPLGTTPDILMATPSLKTRVSVVNPATNSIQWTKSGNSQQVYGGVLVGAP